MTLEQNIERIAVALEALAKNNTTAVSETDQTNNAQVSAPLEAVPMGVYPTSVGGTQVRVPVNQPGVNASAIMPAATPVPTQVPVTAAAQQYSFDQLAVATAALASSGKDVFAILGKFGANTLMDVPPERFGEYAAALREAGAVI